MKIRNRIISTEQRLRFNMDEIQFFVDCFSIKGFAVWQSLYIDRKYEMDGNFTYIVECSDHTLYTGWTNDLEKRIQAHNEGKGAKYTKTRRPVRLVYFETFSTKEEAMSREYRIKRLSRKEKEQLIAGRKI